MRDRIQLSKDVATENTRTGKEKGSGRHNPRDAVELMCGRGKTAVPRSASVAVTAEKPFDSCSDLSMV